MQSARSMIQPALRPPQNQDQCRAPLPSKSATVDQDEDPVIELSINDANDAHTHQHAGTFDRRWTRTPSNHDHSCHYVHSVGGKFYAVNSTINVTTHGANARNDASDPSLDDDSTYTKGFGLGLPFVETLARVELGSADRNRASYTLKKRMDLPTLLSHQSAYKPYAEIKSPEIRSYMVQLAHMFTDLDELFADFFLRIMLASDVPKLKKNLELIRHEISARQVLDKTQSYCQDEIYLGDLGHHCENLLRQYELAKYGSNGTEALPTFRFTHSDEQSWIDYLEDGFEIPYWKMMLDAFSTSRLNRPTLGGKVISMALISMRADILRLRCKLQKVLTAMPEDEGSARIVIVVDKRIKILRGFTDRVVLDKQIQEFTFESVMPPLIKASGEIDGGMSGGKAVTDRTGKAVQPSSDPLLLVTLVLLTLIVATVPFVIGFKASNEIGAVSDADFWFNISGSIFTMMSNFVMIIQLTDGRRFSKHYMFVWIWFTVGVLSTIISVAVYPFCNTAWSSLLSFFATIAGFGATLSVAMTVRTSDSGEQGGERKAKVE